MNEDYQETNVYNNRFRIYAWCTKLIFAGNQIFLFLQIKRETKLTVFERFQSHTAIMPGEQISFSPEIKNLFSCKL